MLCNATKLRLGGIVEKLSLLDGLHSFVVCGKEHVLQLQARALSIFKLAPTPKELQTIRENAEKAMDDPFAAYLQEALGADFLANLGPVRILSSLLWVFFFCTSILGRNSNFYITLN